MLCHRLSIPFRRDRAHGVEVCSGAISDISEHAIQLNVKTSVNSSLGPSASSEFCAASTNLMFEQKCHLLRTCFHPRVELRERRSHQYIHSSIFRLLNATSSHFYTPRADFVLHKPKIQKKGLPRRQSLARTVSRRLPCAAPPVCLSLRLEERRQRTLSPPSPIVRQPLFQTGRSNPTAEPFCTMPTMFP